MQVPDNRAGKRLCAEDRTSKAPDETLSDGEMEEEEQGVGSEQGKGQARLRFNGDAALVSAMLPQTFLLNPAQQEVHVGREGPLSLSLFATLS